ncbi:MAG: TonB-dependent receptor [Chitinophagaceae bacterium]|nr:MAG: TonB-dependent receptor [Chitinophagaceae bacterium]
MTKLYGLLMGLAMSLSLGLSAQTKEVTGKVVDVSDSSGLSDVTVKVKDGPNTTATLPDGTFRITVPASATTLVFTYVGYKEVEQQISSLMMVSMSPGDKSLNEVVVVGYGSATKREITGSIVKLGGSEVENLPFQSFESAMQGKAPGVVIESGSGKVGQAMKIRIRGTSSISASSQPLYVVDGLPVVSNSVSDGTNDPTNPLVDINPNDIESIEVLKDASASAIYGARAANGVILITTKKGKLGRKTVIEFNLANTFSNPTRKRGFMNAAQYYNMLQQAARNDGRIDFQDGFYGSEEEGYQDYLGLYEGAVSDYALGTDFRNGEVNTNWQDQLFRKNAMSQQADVSVSGGSDKTRFFVSGFYNQQDAIVINNRFNRYGGRLNLDHKVSDILTVGLNLALNRSQLDRVSNDNAFSTPGQLVAQLPLSPLKDPTTGELNGNTLYSNGLFDAQYNTDIQATFRSFGNAFGELKILPSLTFRSELGADILNLYQESFQGRQTTDGAGVGRAGNVITQSASLNTNNFFTWAPKINDNHKISTIVGMSYLQNDTKRSLSNGEGYPSDAVKNLSGASEITFGTSTNDRYTFLSYFLRSNYSLKDKYLLSVSVRADGSSRFGENSRYGWFPAASLGWVMSDENFMSGLNFLSYLKLRASYGLTGNAEIGQNNFLALYGVSNYPGLPGFTPTQLGNPDLRWEKTAQFDAGIDFGLFNNRLSGEVDYYQKNTSDLLLNVNIPLTTGYGTLLQNLGKMFNKGVEASLTSRNIEGKFKWSTSLNFAYNLNRVKDIQGQIIESGVQRAVEGQPIGVFFMREFAGVDPETGDALYYDAEGKTTANYGDAERRVVGKSNPDWTGGFTNTFSYKGFDLNIFFTFVQGNNIYNSAGPYMESGLGGGLDNQTTRYLNAWTKPGDITDVPRVSAVYSTNNRASSFWLHDGSYIRLRNATLGYQLPSKVANLLKLSSARLYVAGNNLWTITKYEGDPEVNTATLGNVTGGIDFYTIPQARSIAIGLNVKL